MNARETVAMSAPVEPDSGTAAGPGKAASADESARPVGPLAIRYSTTRVLPGALARLQRAPGVMRADRSELAETFRMLRSQVLHRLRADGQRVLALTSPRAMPGKSLVAVNLALALAADPDSAVLLVDADLSGHGLQAMFGLDAEPGLGDHLRSGVPLPGLLVNPGVPRLVLLPAGAGGRLHSSELLGTRAAGELVRELKQRYTDRWVLVDLPPLLDSADALAFLPQADTTLMVIEEHATAIADVEAAAELMAPFNLLGTVLAPASPRTAAATRGGWLARWRARRAAGAATRPGPADGAV